MDLIITPAARNTLVVGFIVLISFYAMEYNNDLARENKQVQQEEVAKPVAMTKAEVLSKVKIEDVKIGTGSKEAGVGDTVVVDYEGYLSDGVKFDSSYDRGEPLTIKLGVGQVIPGWDVGVQGMKKGGVRKLTIDPSVGYGPRGAGPIPPNATLQFTVEMKDINPASSTTP